MESIFTLDKFSDFSEKISIDELYEKKRQHDLNELTLYKKILNRIHVKIKTVSRQRNHERCCWYVVPDFILGVSRYDIAACIAYIIDSLQQNEFVVKYYHPNTLFISWSHFIPTYVRNEIKKKTGITINHRGETLVEDQDEDQYADPDQNNPSHSKQGQKQGSSNSNKSGRQYTPIDSYKPSGKLVYDRQLLNELGSRL